MKMDMDGTATVVKHTGSHYLLSMLPEWNLFPAVLRGGMRLGGSGATNPVAVGDIVEFSADVRTVAERETAGVPGTAAERDASWLSGITPENPAVITKVLPRRNYMIRKSVNLSRQAHIIASNIDCAFIIVTLAFPEVKLQLLDRILVTCEIYGIHPVIVLNKCDILDEFPEEFGPLRRRFREIYESAGYRTVEVSARTGAGIEELKAAWKQQNMPGQTAQCPHPDASLPQETEAGQPESRKAPVILFSGVSGVGKSSLIKVLDPKLNPRTAEISEAHLQGRHTTTFYEMYPLCDGEAFVIDTPGIRGFGLVDVGAEEIARYFPEMLRLSEDCRFTPCTHVHEPGCAVKKALEDGLMSQERYASYMGMLDEYKKYR